MRWRRWRGSGGCGSDCLASVISVECEPVGHRARLAGEYRKLRGYAQLNSCASIVKKPDSTSCHHDCLYICDIVELHHVRSAVSLTSSAICF